MHSFLHWLLTQLSPWELAGFIFGVISVWLTVKENIWCWPTGIVNVGLYTVVFWQSRLYADMGLQVVYLALCAYGWYEWLQGGKDQGELGVAATPRRALIVSLLLGTLGSLGLGAILKARTPAAIPWWDASTTAFSLVAQWMLTKKYIENWILWIVVDLVYIGMYIYKALYLTAGLYAIFLVLAIAGWSQWRKSLTVSGTTTA